MEGRVKEKLTLVSVVVKGKARQIENMFEFLDAEQLPLFPWHIGPKPNLVRIDPDEITGRRFYAAGRVDGTG